MLHIYSRYTQYVSVSFIFSQIVNMGAVHSKVIKMIHTKTVESGIKQRIVYIIMETILCCDIVLPYCEKMSGNFLSKSIHRKLWNPKFHSKQLGFFGVQVTVLTITCNVNWNLVLIFLSDYHISCDNIFCIFLFSKCDNITCFHNITDFIKFLWKCFVF